SRNVHFDACFAPGACRTAWKLDPYHPTHVTLAAEHPAAFWLMLLAVPTAWIGHRWLGGSDPLRRWVIVGLRVLLVALLAGTLAGLTRIKTHDRLAVIGIVDLSGS